MGASTLSQVYYGKYPPVLHTYWGDAKVWSNLLENSQEPSQLARRTALYRPLKPRNLCLLKGNAFEIIDVCQWEREPGNSARTLSYLFVAYTSEHFDNLDNDDMTYLHNIGMAAARDAGADAFWVAGSCMQDEEELENDVSTFSSDFLYMNKFGG